MLEYAHGFGHWLHIWVPLVGRAALEVLIIFVFVYGFLRVMEGTRGAGVLKGLALFVAIVAGITMFVIGKFHLEILDWVITRLAPVIAIPLFILFQPEVRRGLIRLGQNPFFRVFFRPQTGFTDELVKATFGLSREKIGALIAIERGIGLRGLVEPGVRMDAEVTSDLLRTIFWPGTPLHDGGVIIRNQRISAAGCLFPLSDETGFSSDVGTRHRAGIGVTEESDAICIIVSEETGRVSLAVGGTLRRDVDEPALRRALDELTIEPVPRD